jgi:hypothetical protein
VSAAWADAATLRGINIAPDIHLTDGGTFRNDHHADA